MSNATSSSHDLLTSLNHIIGYSEMVAERAAADGRGQDVRELEYVLSAGKKLLSLFKEDFGSVAARNLSSREEDDDDVGIDLVEGGTDGARNEGTLLVVDDNPRNRDLLSRRLTSRGYSVRTAAGGKEALEAVAGGSFDVVLLDIMMPEIGGLEVLKAIRETRSVADLPVIMVTSKDESADVVEALRLGANDYVTKPVDLSVTLARIETQLSLKRANELVKALNRELQEAQGKIASLVDSSGEALRDIPAWAAGVADDLAGILRAAEIAVYIEKGGALEPLRETSVRKPTPEEAHAALAIVGAPLPSGEGLVAVTGMSGDLFGVLVIAGKEGRWSDPERQLVATFARQLGGALELQRVRGQLDEAKQRGAATRQALVDRGLVLLDLCPRCGRCFRDPATTCPVDGALLEARLLPFEIQGRYRMILRLAEGGMGEVFRARDLRLGRDVAIKVIRPEHFDSSSARLRFAHEAKVLARIQHENVIAIHDSGELDDSSGFLVTELLRGWDLRNLLRLCGRGSPRQVAELVRQAAAALIAAHRADVIHRDVKPANIFLLARDPSFQIKLLDFGVAKTVDFDYTLTQKGLLVGTPSYMAPEVFVGVAADRRSDVYSFAASIYETLTGRAVLPNDRSLLLRYMVYGQPPAVSALVAGIPITVDALFRSALSKEPENRPTLEEIVSGTRVLETVESESAGWPSDLLLGEQRGGHEGDSATEAALTRADEATMRIKKS